MPYFLKESLTVLRKTSIIMVYRISVPGHWAVFNCANFRNRARAIGRSPIRRVSWRKTRCWTLGGTWKSPWGVEFESQNLGQEKGSAEGKFPFGTTLGFRFHWFAHAVMWYSFGPSWHKLMNTLLYLIVNSWSILGAFKLILPRPSCTHKTSWRTCQVGLTSLSMPE